MAWGGNRHVSLWRRLAFAMMAANPDHRANPPAAQKKNETAALRQKPKTHPRRH